MQVITEKCANGLGKIILNRPEALHALNTEMIATISATLKEWEKDQAVQVILFDATGERAFCAGGDIKALYHAKKHAVSEAEIDQFFALEYELDGYIYDYPKPMIANLDGIVMGGGIGLTYGADYKIVTERTQWAMPEMHISFFPDVGATYFLNQAPGYVGRYVALSAKTFSASDVLYLGTANVFMEQETLKQFLAAIERTDWHSVNSRKKIAELIEQYKQMPSKEGELKQLREKIDMHFQYDSLEQIIASLQKDDHPFAKETCQLLLTHSPLAIKVTLKMLIHGQNKSYKECLQMDAIIAQNFLKHHDFYEGVRSVLIDKDRQPNYTYKSIDDVPDTVVASFFNV